MRPTVFGPLSGCPDCPALFGEGNALIHEPTCPMGRDADRQLDEDREWFETHPWASTRRRPLYPSEILLLQAAGELPPGATVGRVTVVQLSPGVRVKHLHRVAVIPEGGDRR